MNKHSNIQALLYEYLKDELSPEERSMVSDHLASCERCSAELESLQDVFHFVPPPVMPPSEERPEMFWNYFADHVDERLKTVQQKRSSPVVSWIDDLATLLLVRKRFVAAFSTALAVIAVTIVVWMSPAPQTQPAEPPEELVAQNDVQFEPVGDRVRQYFQKSKVLLVGLTNMKTAELRPANFTVERERSRELVQEARYLKYRGIDRRSAKLIRDLEKILIELANMKEQGNVPGIEMIRTGIHQENLLFKIRMAEAMYDTARFMNAKYSY